MVPVSDCHRNSRSPGPLTNASANTVNIPPSIPGQPVSPGLPGTANSGGVPPSNAPTGSSTLDRRDSFLLQMYTQTWNNVNRHLTIIWQSVGVLAGGFAIFSLVDKQILPVDYASSLVVLIAAWLVAHAYDASNWFNRNQWIITNIERQFLDRSDLRAIHPYFGEHRRAGSMLSHVKVQKNLGLGVGTLVLLFHFTTVAKFGFLYWFRTCHPRWSETWSLFSLSKALPYLTVLACAIWVLSVRKSARSDENRLKEDSPGRQI
jgi:hypothetical protein